MPTPRETPRTDRPADSAATPRETIADLRGDGTHGDRSQHRAHAWLYEDLLN